MKSLSILFLLIINTTLFAQNAENILVDIDVENKPISYLFKQIENQSNLSFSYNSNLLNNDSIVNYKASSVSIAEVISTLFENHLEVKRIGRHLVIDEAKKYEKKKVKNENPLVYNFNGKVVNARDGSAIVNANIYDISSRKTILSDSVGKFDFKVTEYPALRNFNVAKSAYFDTIISIDGTEKSATLILLKPNARLSDIESQRQDEIVFIESTRIVSNIATKEGVITAQNLSNVYERRPAQISLVPILGSNYKVSGIIENNFSINIVAGYNGGVNGFEIGGAMNIISRNMQGFQIVGGGNIVGGKTSGVQMAGIINKCNQKVTGFQVAGVTNWASAATAGLQMAGFNNSTRGGLKGGQIAGIFNSNRERLNGFQIAGIFNWANDTLAGAQLSAITNVAKNDMKGVQISAIFNLTSEEVNGTQIAFVNKARINRGFQFGLVNVSDSSRGVALGLFNFVKSGYKAIELNANEVLSLNFTFKSGVDHFYTIYTAGISFAKSNVKGIGFGFGSKLKLGKRFSLSLDATANYISEEEKVDWVLNLDNRFTVKLDYYFLKGMAVSLGPAYNLHLSQVFDENLGVFTTDIAVDPFYTSVNGKTQIQMWIGGELSLRYQF